jgi:tetratricopeptide (TPR) repeat protein
MQVEVGRVLGQGRFEVLSRLGEGGAGVVYEVRDRQSDAHLALKTVRLDEPSALASLKREFRAVQDVAHPNLVRLDELFEENGAWFFTMELVEGKDWLSYVRPGSPAGTLDEAKLRASIAQVVEALSVLHASGTVHRDVKPSNVLVSARGHVKLLDFGIATGANRRQPEAEGVVGTAAFMSPEQVLAEEPTPAGDLYAVGVMLYQALTGKLPFFDRPGHVLEAKLRETPMRVKDVEPGAPADLADLCDSLLRLDPRARPDAAATLEAIGAGNLPSSGEMAVAPEDFVGRSSELGVLQRAFAAASAGGTVTVMVDGVSGVGKSALVRRFLRGLEGRAFAFEGKCNEREYVPYNGIDAIVDGLATHLVEENDAWLGNLSARSLRLLPRLFPAMKRVPFFAAVTDESQSMTEGAPQELRARIFEAFRELLTKLAERQPLVLVIDDIQWADGDTLALLPELLAPPFPPRILLICARRLAEEEAAHPSLIPTVRLAGDVRKLRVGALPTEEVAELASQLSRATPLDRSELEAIAAESRGHPFFLHELVRRSARGGTGRMGQVSLDEALWTRVTLLGEKEQDFVHAIAVAAVPTPLPIIAAAAAIPRRDLPSLMAALRSANVVKASGTGSGRLVAPYHDRVREAVSAHLDARTRRDWNERLARAFEASGERDVERLAVHWDGAGDAGRAQALYREAAERASNALAFDRAVDFYQRALALATATTPDVAATEHALATALVNAGRSGEAARVFLSLAGKSDGRAAIELRGRAANAFLCSGHFAEGTAELRAVLAAVDIAFPGSRLAVIFMILWQRVRLLFRGLGFKAQDPARIDPRALTRVDVCWSVAHGFGMTDATTGTAFHTMGARLSLNLGDPFRAARALSGYALTASIAGRKGRRHTEQVIQAIRALNAKLRDPYIDAFSRAAEGFAAYMLEDWITASAHFAEAIVGFRDRCVGAAYELATVRNMLGRALAHRGRLRELEAQVAPTLRDAIRRNDLFNVVNVRTTAGALLALAHDDVDLAQSEIDETEAALSPSGFQLQHVYWLVAAGMLDLYRGAPEEALRRFAARQAALKRSMLESVQSVRVLTTHLRARLHLAVALSDVARRDQHAEAASRCARQLRSERLPAAEALACLVEATLTLLRGADAVGDGAGELRRAIDLFEKSDMSLYAATSRHVLGRLVGGDEGRNLVEVARACFAGEGVASIDRFVGLYAPGIPFSARG